MKKISIMLIVCMALHTGLMHAQDLEAAPKKQKKTFVTRWHKKAKRAFTYKKIKRTLTAPKFIGVVASGLVTMLGVSFGKHFRRNQNPYPLFDMSGGKGLPEIPKKPDPDQEPWEEGYTRFDGSEPFSQRTPISKELLLETLKNAHQQEIEEYQNIQDGDIEANLNSFIDIQSDGELSGNISDKENDAFFDDQTWISEIEALDQNKNEGDQMSEERAFTHNQQFLNELLTEIDYPELPELPVLKIESIKPKKNKDTKRSKNYGVITKGSGAAILATLAQLEEQEPTPEWVQEGFVPYPQRVSQQEKLHHPIPYGGYMAQCAYLRYLKELPLPFFAEHHKELVERYANGERLPYYVYVQRFIHSTTNELFKDQKEMKLAYKKNGNLSDLRMLLNCRYGIANR